MKKALNNPLVVGVLVLLALAFVLRDFIHLAPGLSSNDSAPAVAVLPTALPLPVVTKLAQPVVQAAPAASAALKHTDWKAVATTALLDRDPFSAQVVTPSSHLPTAMNDAEDVDGVTAPAMDLRAIVSAADTHYASINGQMLEIGDAIDGWKLVAIGVNRVQLRGKQGLLTLDIDGGARMGGRALKMTKKATVTQPKAVAVPSASTSATTLPNSVEDLNMYQGLFDSLIKSGIVPNVPSLK
ncbi:MAG: hypothetical protein R8J85_02735 [Mariprofundales bacterium]